MNGYLDIDLAKIRQSEFHAEAHNQALLKSFKESQKKSPAILLYRGVNSFSRFTNWLLVGIGFHRG